MINIVSIALLVGAISFSCVTLAKYVSENNAKTPIEPAYFHFNCSKAENETYVLNVEEGEDTASATFSVNNYVFDAYSQADITYSIELIDDETLTSTTVKSGTLAKNLPSEDEIEITNLYEGKTYTVKVSSTAPYVREYSFKYYVAKKNLETFYTVTDNGTWIQLDLYVGDELPSENISVVYESNLTPNPTSETTKNWETSGIHIIDVTTLQTNTHYTYEFVELVSDDYSQESKTEIIDSKITL